MATKTKKKSNDVKHKRFFVRGEQLTDNVWWYCGDDPESAQEGLMNFLQSALPDVFIDVANGAAVHLMVIEFDTRMMTDREFNALPSGD